MSVIVLQCHSHYQNVTCAVICVAVNVCSVPLRNVLDPDNKLNVLKDVLNRLS